MRLRIKALGFKQQKTEQTLRWWDQVQTSRCKCHPCYRYQERPRNKWAMEIKQSFTLTGSLSQWVEAQWLGKLAQLLLVLCLFHEERCWVSREGNPTPFTSTKFTGNFKVEKAKLKGLLALKWLYTRKASENDFAIMVYLSFLYCLLSFKVNSFPALFQQVT